MEVDSLTMKFAAIQNEIRMKLVQIFMQKKKKTKINKCQQPRNYHSLKTQNTNIEMRQSSK